MTLKDLPFAGRRLLFLFACVILVALVPPAEADDSVLEVIELHYRPAQEVVPLIQPFLAPGGTITGTELKLIVRTTPANLADIKRLLASLDAAPKQLLVTVRQDLTRVAGGRGAQVSGSATVGDARVSVAGPERHPARATAQAGSDDAGVRIRAYATRDRDEDLNTHQLRVLEGRPAYIDIGRSVPAAEGPFVFYGYRPGVSGGIRYRDVSSGFYVVARVAGDDTVQLELSPHADSLSRHGGGQINVRRMHTTVSGRLGEWIAIGALARERTSQERGYAYSTEDRDLRQSTVYLRVDRLD